METIRRYSPIFFSQKPALTEMRDGWEVVLGYEDEGEGPFLIDLSHITKFDVQHTALSRIQPGGQNIPESPGTCIIKEGWVINRLNRTQATLWFLAGEQAPIPAQADYTDITEAFALLAIAGDDVFGIMEKLTSLDLTPRGKQPPFILQGPVLQIPCQILVRAKNMVLIAFSRSYAQSMTDAILQAGLPWNLQPAGERVFKNFLERIT
ncbi:MAG: sarcosine oxidase subunit gamma SoxG [Desulfobacterales bacterium]|jgi:hypothetical protein